MAGVKKIIKTTEGKKPARLLDSLVPLLLILTIALGATYLVVGYQAAISHDFGSQLAKQPVISAAQLENTYQAKLLASLSDYLKTADLADGQFLAKTEQLKNQLLALIVPAKYRDRHLALILSLDKLETESKNGDLKAAAQEIEKIRKDY
jgi:hypothetical protein